MTAPRKRTRAPREDAAGAPTNSLHAFQAAAKAASEERFELCLFIAGTTPRSAAALANVVDVCEERLLGRYDLVVVDVYQQPERARADQVVAAPTLVKRRPPPLRRMIGDLSDRAQVLKGLGLPLDPAASHEEDP